MVVPSLNVPCLVTASSVALPPFALSQLVSSQVASSPEHQPSDDYQS